MSIPALPSCMSPPLRPAVLVVAPSSIYLGIGMPPYSLTSLPILISLYPPSPLLPFSPSSPFPPPSLLPTPLFLPPHHSLLTFSLPLSPSLPLCIPLSHPFSPSLIHTLSPSHSFPLALSLYLSIALLLHSLPLNPSRHPYNSLSLSLTLSLSVSLSLHLSPLPSHSLYLSSPLAVFQWYSPILTYSTPSI